MEELTMAPYVDGYDKEKRVYLYHYVVTVKPYHQKASKENVYGIIAASSTDNAEVRIRNMLIEKHLTGVTGAIESTSIKRMAINCLDIDEIATPLQSVSDAYLNEVLRVVGPKHKAA